MIPLKWPYNAFLEAKKAVILNSLWKGQSGITLQVRSGR
jgi:hypothetical protein